MSTYIIIAIVIATIIAVLILLGALSPSKAVVTRTAVVDAPAEDIYNLLVSTDGFTAINPYKDNDPSLSIEPFGPTAGVGAGFNFKGKEGKGSQTIAAVIPNQSVTMQIDVGFVQPVQNLSIIPTADGTKVTWQVQSDLGKNPLMRLMGNMMDRMLGPKYELGLQNLQRHFA